MKDDLEMMLKELVVAYFKVLPQHLPVVKTITKSSGKN
jgi:hypothetical protein